MDRDMAQSITDIESLGLLLNEEFSVHNPQVIEFKNTGKTLPYGHLAIETFFYMENSS